MFESSVIDTLTKEEIGLGLPVLVCWYSGGFTRDEGLKTLDTLQETLKKAGIKDQLVLDHSNEYGFTGEGYEPWPRYVDKLIDIIDAQYAGRPLILFGHSKGTGPAMSVASRLGARVLKIYVVACKAWLPGRQTPWERLSHGFKRKGDQDLIAWFAGLNPGNMLLETVAYAPEDQFDTIVEESSWLKTKLSLMKLQYRDAMYPDMSSREIDAFSAELCAVSPLLDGGSQPSDMAGFRKYSTRFEMWNILAGHADVLTNTEFLCRLSEDILFFFGVASKPKPPTNAEPEPQPWLNPFPRTPPMPMPKPTPAPEPTPQLSVSAVKEIHAILKAQSSKNAQTVASPNLLETPDTTSAGDVLKAYTVHIGLSPSGISRLRKIREHRTSTEDPENREEEQVVMVDESRGPLVYQADGSTKFLLEVPSFTRVADKTPQYGPGKPTWSRMQSTDRVVLLDMAARINVKMLERIHSAKVTGRKLHCQLPGFLKEFEPRSREEEAHFWAHAFQE